MTGERVAMSQLFVLAAEMSDVVCATCEVIDRVDEPSLDLLKLARSTWQNYLELIEFIVDAITVDLFWKPGWRQEFSNLATLRQHVQDRMRAGDIVCLLEQYGRRA
jgi:hypothetical protein